MLFVLNDGKYQRKTKAAFTVVFRIKHAVDDSISIVKQSFDNEVTPYFALVICLWGKNLPFCYLMALIKILN